MEKDIIGFWVGIISLVLAIPLGIASNLPTTRLLSYLERRRLIKARKTRQQALQVYKRVRAFQEGRSDKYPFYLLLASSAVLCAIASSTILVGVLLISPSVENTVLSLVVSFALALVAIVLLAGIYETARQLERFDDYKKEFEERWGPLSEDDLKA
jgi:hypothetical protein